MDKKQIDMLIKDFVNEMFRGTNKAILQEDDTLAVKMAKRNLGNAIQDYSQDERNQEYFQNKAKNIGINIQDKGEARRNRFNSVSKNGYEDAVRKIGDDLKQKMSYYKELTTPITATTKDEKQAELNRKSELAKKLGGPNGIRRFKDAMNMLSLTPVYDQERASEAGINRAPFGTNYIVDKDGETSLTPNKPRNSANATVTGYDFENFDITNIPDDEILKYFKTGTREGHVFDDNDGDVSRYNGEKYTYGQLADIAKNGGEQGELAMEDLKNLYFKAMFNKLLNNEYGYDFKMPTAMYTFGNAKLPDDTLVVNFTSAHRCPAWNECLVGYACYARGSEHNYEGLFKKNSNLHLMWSAAHQDPKVMDAMLNVIRMHLINPLNIASALLNNPKTANKWIKIVNQQIGKISPLTNNTFNATPHSQDNVLAEPNWGEKDVSNDEGQFESVSSNKRTIIEAKPTKKSKKPTGARELLAAYIFNNKFSDIFSKQDLSVIKNTPNALRARFIRLNEEGDFIGQWLLDAFDKFAGELKLIGVTTAAYTCRNLNYTNIENIIINASTIDVGTSGEKDNKVSKAIARRFFAVSSSLYNSLEDTYVPNGKTFDYMPKEKTKKGEWDGSKPIIPLHKTAKGLHVKYQLKPFTNGEGMGPVTFNDAYDPNGEKVKNRLYYKCPCGRHGDVLENGKPIKMDCYLCRMCYEPKNLQTGEIYVLVEVHGDNIDSFDMNAANANRKISNKMATYREAREIFNNRLSESHKNAEQLGIKMVGQNVINSVKTHLANIAQSDSVNKNMAENTFKNIMNRITEAEKKH